MKQQRRGEVGASTVSGYLSAVTTCPSPSQMDHSPYDRDFESFSSGLQQAAAVSTGTHPKVRPTIHEQVREQRQAAFDFLIQSRLDSIKVYDAYSLLALSAIRERTQTVRAWKKAIGIPDLRTGIRVEAEKLNQQILALNAFCQALQKSTDLSVELKKSAADAAIAGVFRSPAMLVLGSSPTFQNWVTYGVQTPESAVRNCLDGRNAISRNPKTRVQTGIASQGSNTEWLEKAPFVNERLLSTALHEVTAGIASAEKRLLDGRKALLSVKLSGSETSLAEDLRKLREEIGHGIEHFPIAVSRLLGPEFRSKGPLKDVPDESLALVLCDSLRSVVADEELREMGRNLVVAAGIAALPASLILGGGGATLVLGLALTGGELLDGKFAMDHARLAELRVRDGLVTELLSPKPGMEKLNSKISDQNMERFSLFMGALGLGGDAAQIAKKIVARSGKNGIEAVSHGAEAAIEGVIISERSEPGVRGAITINPREKKSPVAVPEGATDPVQYVDEKGNLLDGKRISAAELPDGHPLKKQIATLEASGVQVLIVPEDARFSASLFTVPQQLILKNGERTNPAYIITMRVELFEDEKSAKVLLNHEVGHWKMITRGNADFGGDFARVSGSGKSLPFGASDPGEYIKFAGTDEARQFARQGLNELRGVPEPEVQKIFRESAKRGTPEVPANSIIGDIREANYGLKESLKFAKLEVTSYKMALAQLRHPDSKLPGQYGKLLLSLRDEGAIRIVVGKNSKDEFFKSVGLNPEKFPGFAAEPATVAELTKEYQLLYQRELKRVRAEFAKGANDPDVQEMITTRVAAATDNAFARKHPWIKQFREKVEAEVSERIDLFETAITSLQSAENVLSKIISTRKITLDEYTDLRNHWAKAIASLRPDEQAAAWKKWREMIENGRAQNLLTPQPQERVRIPFVPNKNGPTPSGR